MKIAELFEEANQFKLYIEDAYGNGFDPKAVKKGEVLTREPRGDFVDFVGITSDGKKVIVSWDGKDVNVEPEKVSGIILPASEKVEDRKDFAN